MPSNPRGESGTGDKHKPARCYFPRAFPAKKFISLWIQHLAKEKQQPGLVEGVPCPGWNQMGFELHPNPNHCGVLEFHEFCEWDFRILWEWEWDGKAKEQLSVRSPKSMWDTQPQVGRRPRAGCKGALRASFRASSDD